MDKPLTQQDLARKLDVSRQTIQNYKSKGMPMHSFEAAEAWLVERKAQAIDDADPEMREAKLNVLLERHRQLKMANDIEEGDLFRKSEVFPRVQNLAVAQKAVLRRLLEQEAPEKLVGLDAVRMRVMLKRVVDDVCSCFEEGLAQWMEKGTEDATTQQIS